MKKILKNIICVIGVITLLAVLVINLVFTADLSEKEEITINTNSIVYLAGALIIAYTLYNICKIIRHKACKIKGKHIILGIIIVIYVAVQIVWINERNACPAVDQKTTYQVAVRNGRRKLRRSNTKRNNIWSRTSK